MKQFAINDTFTACPQLIKYTHAAPTTTSSRGNINPAQSILTSDAHPAQEEFDDLSNSESNPKKFLPDSILSGYLSLIKLTSKIWFSTLSIMPKISILLLTFAKQLNQMLLENNDGLPNSMIRQLPRMRIGNSLRSCVFCLEHFQKEQIARFLPCRHYFHSCCLKPWFETNSTCPVCRFDIKGFLKDE